MLLGHSNIFNRVNNRSSLYHQYIVIACFLRLAIIQLTNAASVNFTQFPRYANLVNTSRCEYSFDPSTVVMTPRSRGQAINKSTKMPPTKKADLTTVSWAHAVNSQDQLTDALKSTVDMIEADIVMGKINGTGPDIPVMAHPPANSSDLSLDSFLRQIDQHNLKNSTQMKGIKLDFKSIEAFEGSIQILEDTVPQMTYPIWLNADIVSGPVNQTTTVPVDPQRFFDGCYKFQNVVLSLGWTTKWSSEPSYGYYETEAMEDAIRNNYITETGQPITFAVRAGIAATSITELQNLVADLSLTNHCTLTIWSAPNDYVDIERLLDLIYCFGRDRIYLDVPEELQRQLNLSSTEDDDDDDDEIEGGSGGGRVTITSLLNFSLLSAGVILLSLYMNRLRA